MSKRLIVLSDGTGNSSAALFKTNVYRLYGALDQKPPTEEQAAAGKRRQIVYYDDGVGTSAFRPLSLLGGVFGWGLKRNVLDLYMFLCRNYEPGDQIYAFGFSRGAFTIRVLVGFIVTQGLLRNTDERTLALLSLDSYRNNRRRFTRAGKAVNLLRWLRDEAVRLKRRIRSQPVLARENVVDVAEIEFVGVWDTVAAYGLPLAEMTRGIDKWVWQLSMPDLELSVRVNQARHALALDDERDTFHPLVWDELAERKYEGTPKAGRIEQVWFAGMHSDVGGGYPDDSLALVSLRWMMGEAAAAGLRFDPHGVSGYYRYQPRKIGARTDPPDRTTLLMQDPDRGGKGYLTSVRVHDSVLARIEAGSDRYAPIVLPASYAVETNLAMPGASAGSVSAAPVHGEEAAHASWRAVRQERVWNDVWKRRWVYFATVIVSFFLFALPLLQWFWPPSACAGFRCLLSPAISSSRLLLPEFLEFWPNAFARMPLLFLVTVLTILGLRTMGAGLSRKIQATCENCGASPPRRKALRRAIGSFDSGRARATRSSSRC